MDLKGAAVRSGNHRNSSEHFQENAKSMSPAHVSVNQIDSVFANPFGDAVKFRRRKAIHARRKEWNLSFLELFDEPRVLSNENGDVMPQVAQSLRKNLAVN